MAKLIKATSTFLTNLEMWLEGETKEVGDNQAAELLKAGLAVEVEEVKPTTETDKRETKPAKTGKLEKK